MRDPYFELDAVKLHYEFTLTEFEHIPLLFICKDNSGSRYLCLCNCINNISRWVVTEVKISTILELLNQKISIYNAFKNSAAGDFYLIVGDKDGNTMFSIKDFETMDADNEFTDRNFFLDPGFWDEEEVRVKQLIQENLDNQLWEAIDNEYYFPAVKDAVTAGADVNSIRYDMRPLVDCTRFEDGTVIMKYLLDHGANPNSQDKDGDTVLHDIARSKLYLTTDKCKLSLLVNYHADMHIKNNEGNTPFAEALCCQNYEMAETFVMNGYIPAEEDFELIKDRDERNKLKAQFMELARTVKVNAVQKDEESEICAQE